MIETLKAFYNEKKVGFVMKQFTYTIQDSMGIHARPAGLLVKAAAAYKDTVIKISSNGKEADGGEEEAAAAAMETFFKENL